MNNVLEVKNLCKRYEQFALSDVSFHIPEGFIMGFIGPNGAGKTTTIKSILNMTTPDSGDIQVFGRRLTDDETSIKEDIGIVMDSAFFVDAWTLSEVEKALRPFYRNWNSETYAQCLRRFQLDPKKKVKDLSRGMKVKLMLATALSHDAKLLILDEPTSGLDPVARDELMELLGAFVEDEKHSVLFSTHITSDLEKIADYITFIVHGEIMFSGEKDTLMESFALVKGGKEELTPALEQKLLGLRRYSTGFEGMLPTRDAGVLPPGIEPEPISLDDIIVFMNKEGYHE